VVSATRIEPPLHPDGPEKILADYGIEPEEFDELKLLREYETFKKDKTTEGIFAPWAIYKETSNLLVVTTHYMLHNQKKIQIYSIGLY
jgi:hypothetical protein